MSPLSHVLMSLPMDFEWGKNFSPLVFCESDFLSCGYCLGKK